jgi:hypothetical protein
MPLMSELVELLWKAYEGRGAAKAESKVEPTTV